MTNKRTGSEKQASEQGPLSTRRNLPQVERLASAIGDSWPHPLRVAASRAVIEQASNAALGGTRVPEFDELVSAATRYLELESRRGLTQVINATGVILHTNLGRAPVSRATAEAVVDFATGFSNLEYDLESAQRGSRYTHAAALIKSLTGAEDALVVNNNAAATLLALRGLALGGEVIVSRGELIEIGGEFRLPDVMAESGALLREVGTTNRTHLSDYENAIGPETAAVLKVHTSNFQVVGFTKQASSAELARMCKEKGVKFINDLGSGLLSHKVAGSPKWLAGEPSVDEAVAEGTDIVCFSGDKLLGGPQCGILCGSAEAVQMLRKQPLLRALRVDKITLAALEATLTKYSRREEADLPLWQMARLDTATLSERAHRVVKLVHGERAKLDIVDGHSTFGGGAAPGSEIPTVLIEIAPRDVKPTELFRGLVDNDPPIITTVENDRVLIDLRTVLEGGDELIAAALNRLL
ncbi:MAG TPA: L-seryl-tRNA(Sec) selenium transferase [Actinomycetota bacterium]|nr:L-seryl-tRNA(Sec) selenium transferase [Actinomycetota bacterium]